MGISEFVELKGDTCWKTFKRTFLEQKNLQDYTCRRTLWAEHHHRISNCCSEIQESVNGLCNEIIVYNRRWFDYYSSLDWLTLVNLSRAFCNWKSEIK